MRKLDLYQVDAFAEKLFTGNPAAVMPLQQWLPDGLLQQLAQENNLSETVFFVPSQKAGVDFDIRWFTPTTEVNLCGHATLAAAWVLLEQLQFHKPEVVFHSKSGLLRVRRGATGLQMDFPAWPPERLSDYPANLAQLLGVPEILGVYKHRDWLVEVEKEAWVRQAKPDFQGLKQLGAMIILTAPGSEADFVSRFFAPGAGVDEDPVTGSAHSQLVPFWSDKLGKRRLQARQLSQRGGVIACELLDNGRVLLGGNCVFYMKGEVQLPL
ncbi:MAG: PhzF family phenazine biosynthesis protein [Lacibacter sp.]